MFTNNHKSDETIALRTLQRALSIVTSSVTQILSFQTANKRKFY